MAPLLPSIQIETGPKPQSAVVWLHGLGADGNDFASLVPELDLSQCPAIRFVFPHAPSMPVTINGGYVMPAWYDIRGTDLTTQQDVVGIRHSEQAICALLEQQMALGVPASHIVLAGFSQGCAMALHTGLRFPHSLAGVVALSGYLPLADKFVTECNSANKKTPIFMAHGSDDPVVIPARGVASRDQLTQLGYAVQWHTYPMPHSLHPKEITDISVFLSTVLGQSEL
jgi:phospholipase/carboxylesterase